MLPDVLAEDLRVVFCGTAAGTRSAEASAYYAGPGNKFWRVIHEIGLTPRQFVPEEYPQLIDHSIGLTDLVKGKAGSDSDLASDDFGVDVLRAKLRQYTPRLLCFNGKKAAQVFLQTKRVGYGPVAIPFGATQLFVAPSTSGAANGYWDQTQWHDLATLIRGTA